MNSDFELTMTALGVALCDPTRLAVLQLALANPSVCMGDIARALSFSGATICHHVDRLEAAGLVERRRRGSRIVVLARHDRWRLLRGVGEACALRRDRRQSGRETGAAPLAVAASEGAEAMSH
jgi:DNA-binding transcriptional ArsR family regulator